MDFNGKSYFVAGRHHTEPPASATYDSVVSRDSVFISILLAALNYIDVLSLDLQGTYLNTPCNEKVWFRSRA